MKQKTFFNLALACSFATFSATAKEQPRLAAAVDQTAMQQWCDSVFDTMNTEQRIGQLFMPIVEVKQTPYHQKLLKRYVDEFHIGGILFSKGTVSEQAQLTNFADSLSQLPLMISLDGEWGLNMRLTDAPRFPRNMMLGAIQDDWLISAYGKEVGRQCREMGIHINFAPVLDMNSNPRNPVIGTRAFGESIETVADKAIAYSRGIESEGVMAVGKHFPGHGDTSEDSHHTLPVLLHSHERMYDFEMEPFRRYIEQGFSGMLTAHLSVPSLDGTAVPSSLSKPIVTDVLQDSLGFDGLIFTDGLAMKGVANQPDFCVRALLAGNDILLGAPNMPAAVTSVRRAVANGTLPLSVVEDRCYKVLQYKYILGVANKEAIEVDSLLERLNTPTTRMLNDRLHAEAMTVLKNERQVLPLKRLDEQSMAVVTVGSIQDQAFSKMLNQYNEHEVFHYDAAQGAAQRNKARQNDLIIVAVASKKAADRQWVESLVRGKNYILVFFTDPYALTAYKSVIEQAQGVVLAYENSVLSGQFAAQLLYGGIGAKGKLSVTIPQLYPEGTGLTFDANRLGYAQPEAVGLNSETLSRIDSIILAGIADEAFPGCQILVAKDQQIVYQRSFGNLDNTQNTPVSDDVIYDLASVSKAIGTVSAVMRLRDQYQIKTSEPLSKYIPELGTEDKKNITIRETLFHETGLPASAQFYRMTMNVDTFTVPLFNKTRDENYRLQVDKSLYAHKDAAFLPEWISTTPNDSCTLHVAKGIYNRACFRDSVLQRIAAMELKNRGGYRYSCINFVLLRQLVENVSKTSLDTYLDQAIFSPLGAKSLQYNPLKNGVSLSMIAPTEHDMFIRKQLLVGHVHDEISAFSGGVEGNAGLFGNARDMAKVLQMLLNEGEYGGERLLSAETVRLFTMSKSPRSRRGLGYDKPDMERPEYSSATEKAPGSLFGHTGFTGTMFWADPDNDIIYIFLTNRVYPHRWNYKLMRDNYRTRVQEAIYDAMR